MNIVIDNSSIKTHQDWFKFLMVPLTFHYTHCCINARACATRPRPWGTWTKEDVVQCERNPPTSLPTSLCVNLFLIVLCRLSQGFVRLVAQKIKDWSETNVVGGECSMFQGGQTLNVPRRRTLSQSYTHVCEMWVGLSMIWTREDGFVHVVLFEWVL